LHIALGCRVSFPDSEGRERKSVQHIGIADLHCFESHPLCGSAAETGLKESEEINKAKARFHFIAQFMLRLLEK
jgi:hypothetical protein